MKITYLGTAAAEGIPALFCSCRICSLARSLGGRELRSRSQAIVDGKLLVDFPPDTLSHVQRAGIDLLEIEDLIVTHSHQDHFYPEDFLFRCPPFSHLVAEDEGGRARLRIHGNGTVMTRFMETMARGASLSPGRYLEFRRIAPFETRKLCGIDVTALPAVHDTREECLVYLLEREGNRILYGNDTGILSGEALDFLRGRRLDLLSLDCTMLAHGDGRNHMGLEDVARLRDLLAGRRCIGPRTRTVITHFSHNGGMTHAEAETAAGYHGFEVAWDGLTIEVQDSAVPAKGGTS